MNKCRIYQSPAIAESSKSHGQHFFAKVISILFSSAWQLRLQAGPSLCAASTRHAEGASVQHRISRSDRWVLDSRCGRVVIVTNVWFPLTRCSRKSVLNFNKNSRRLKKHMSDSSKIAVYCDPHTQFLKFCRLNLGSDTK